jgi:hypothetical protein
LEPQRQVEFVHPINAFGEKRTGVIGSCRFTFCDFGLELALEHVHRLELPMASRNPSYLLVELTAGSARVPLEEILEATLTEEMERAWIADGVLAISARTV